MSTRVTEGQRYSDAERQVALNQILFGPPGTGKTYATIEAALEILDPEVLESNRGDRSVLKERFDELVVDGRAKFVTFHQSFSYEDFVEGVGALVADEQLGYEVRSGVFKKFCDQAASLVTEADDFDDAIESLRELARAEVVLDVSGSKFRLRALEEDFIAILDDGLVEQVLRVGDLRRLHRKEVVATNIPRDRSGHSELKALLRFFSENLKSTLSVRMAGGAWFVEGCPLDSNILVRYEKNSGKVYVDRAALRRWLSLNGYDPRKFQGALREYGVLISDSAKIVLGKGVGIQSAQRICWVFRFGDASYYGRAFGVDASEVSQLSYTGLLQAVLVFMQENCGLQPAESKSGFRPFLPYVLIIDEINRGNVSRIFGELITLIEESKRAGADEELSVVLPYSKERFSVPSNVYLIGTMNTADRSLAGLDIALRRRFTFREMPPRPELLDEVVVEGINIGQLLRTMNERIEVLLDRDHCLGHAYFMPLLQDSSLERLATIFRNQVLPLLQEYFFEDWQRIQWVLNDHRKAAMDRFVYQSERDLRALFGSEAEVSVHNLPWRINEAAFGRVLAYAGIIAVPAKVAAPLGVSEAAEA